MHAAGVQKHQFLAAVAAVAAVAVSEERFHEKRVFWASELRLVERIRHLDLRL